MNKLNSGINNNLIFNPPTQENVAPSNVLEISNGVTTLVQVPAANDSRMEAHKSWTSNEVEEIIKNYKALLRELDFSAYEAFNPIVEETAIHQQIDDIHRVMKVLEGAGKEIFNISFELDTIRAALFQNDLTEIREEIIKKYDYLSERVYELAKLLPENPVVTLATSTKLEPGQKLYHCTKTEHISSILTQGILLDTTTNFGDGEMGRGLYVSTCEPCYQNPNLPSVIIFEVVSDLEGISTRSYLDYRKDVEKFRLQSNQLEEGYQLLQNDFPFLRQLGITPRDTQMTILNPSHKIRIVGVAINPNIESNGKIHLKEEDIIPIETYCQKANLSLHRQWCAPLPVIVGRSEDHLKVRQGKKVLFFKKMRVNGEIPLQAEVGASRFSRRLLGDFIPPAEEMTVKGQKGIAQPFVKFQRFDQTKIAPNGQLDLSQLSQGQLEELFAHMLVDFVISNHDTHARQFGVSPKNHILSFDKGNAFRFFKGKRTQSKDAMQKIGPEAQIEHATFYNMPIDQEASIYVRLREALIKGEIRIDFQSPIIQHVIEKCSQLTIQDVKHFLKQYAHVAFSGQEQMFYADVLDRAQEMKEQLLAFEKMCPQALFFKKQDNIPQSLNGIAFSSLSQKIGRIALQNESENPQITSYFRSLPNPSIDEPVAAISWMNEVPVHIDELQQMRLWKSGVVLMESDGRIWIRKVAGSFGGYTYALPKGELDPQLTLQQNALKELYEETGMTGTIQSFLCDSVKPGSKERFYVAMRQEGDPREAGFETEYMVLVTPEEACRLLTAEEDRNVCRLAAEKMTSPLTFEEIEEKRIDETIEDEVIDIQEFFKELSQEDLDSLAPEEILFYFNKIDESTQQTLASEFQSFLDRHEWIYEINRGLNRKKALEEIEDESLNDRSSRAKARMLLWRISTDCTLPQLGAAAKDPHLQPYLLKALSFITEKKILKVILPLLPAAILSERLLTLPAAKQSTLVKFLLPSQKRHYVQVLKQKYPKSLTHLKTNANTDDVISKILSDLIQHENTFPKMEYKENESAKEAFPFVLQAVEQEQFADDLLNSFIATTPVELLIQGLLSSSTQLRQKIIQQRMTLSQKRKTLAFFQRKFPNALPQNADKSSKNLDALLLSILEQVPSNAELHFENEELKDTLFGILKAIRENRPQEALEAIGQLIPEELEILDCMHKTLFTYAVEYKQVKVALALMHKAILLNRDSDEIVHHSQSLSQLLQIATDPWEKTLIRFFLALYSHYNYYDLEIGQFINSCNDTSLHMDELLSDRKLFQKLKKHHPSLIQGFVETHADLLENLSYLAQSHLFYPYLSLAQAQEVFKKIGETVKKEFHELPNLKNILTNAQQGISRVQVWDESDQEFCRIKQVAEHCFPPLALFVASMDPEWSALAFSFYPFFDEDLRKFILALLPPDVFATYVESQSIMKYKVEALAFASEEQKSAYLSKFSLSQVSDSIEDLLNQIQSVISKIKQEIGLSPEEADSLLWSGMEVKMQKARALLNELKKALEEGSLSESFQKQIQSQFQNYRKQIQEAFNSIQKIKSHIHSLNKESSEEIPPEFACMYTDGIMGNPVKISCGHTFEKSEITNWVQNGNNPNCPICRSYVDLSTAVPDQELSEKIEEWLKLHPEMRAMQMSVEQAEGVQEVSIADSPSNDDRDLSLFFRAIQAEQPLVPNLSTPQEMRHWLNNSDNQKILSTIKKLHLSGCRMTTLPKEIGLLPNLEQLYLNGNYISSLPAEIAHLSNLKELYLLGNYLTTLPNEIGRLSQLRVLCLSSNIITSLPSQIGNLSNLEELFLYANRLRSLPVEIGNLVNLKLLDLQKNDDLVTLPNEIENLSNLQWFL